MKKQLIYFTAILLTTTIANALQYYHYTPQLHYKNQPAANLGFGYSTDKDTYTVSCITPGTTTYGGASEGLVDVAKNYTLAEVQKQLNLSADVKVKAGIFDSNASASFVHMSQDDQYSETFLYRTTIKLKNSIYNPPATGDILNRVGKAYQNNPANFREICGDKYVAQLYWGGYLYLAVKMQFHDTSDKQTFNAAMSASIGSVFSMQGKLSQAISKINKQGAISIYALQIGGDPTQLGKILGGQGGSAPITECSFDDMSSCKTMLNNLVTYATNTTGNNFPTQIKIGSSTTPISAAQTGEDLLDYAYLGVPIISHTTVTPQILQARNHLATELAQTVAGTHRAKFLLATSMYQPYSAKLKSLLDNLEDNHEQINQAGTTCFSDIADCITTEQQTDKTLKPIDKGLLLGPDHMLYKSAQLTFSPNNFLTNHGSAPWALKVNFTATNIPSGIKALKITGISNIKMGIETTTPEPVLAPDQKTGYLWLTSLPTNAATIGNVQNSKATLTFTAPLTLSIINQHFSNQCVAVPFGSQKCPQDIVGKITADVAVETFKQNP